jgi:hypothetical protein
MLAGSVAPMGRRLAVGGKTGKGCDRLVSAPLIGFTLGVLFAWLARDDIARGSPGSLSSRSLSIVALYTFFIYAPACACFVVLEPDWAGAYLFEGGRARLFSVLGTLLSLSSVPLGFVAAARATRSRRPVEVLRLGAVSGLLAVALTLALFPRLTVRASYAQYHGDFGTEPVAGSPLGMSLFWVLAVVTLVSAYTGRVLRRLG